ncbi:MAG: alpha-glucuronidase [Bacteroidales bacterium]|nr:alpha-glucuronidase [Bacteroidales bacterium]
MKTKISSIALSIIFLGLADCKSSDKDDGYRLWLRYDQIENESVLNDYKQIIQNIIVTGESPTIFAAREEILYGLSALFGAEVPVNKEVKEGCLLIGTPESSSVINGYFKGDTISAIGNEGYSIFSTQSEGYKITVITGNTDVGILYGVFHFLKLLQTRQSIAELNIASKPGIQNRLLNHWDNLDRKVERGYAGFSLWKWNTLPDYIDPRYKDYARANASVGINGTVLTNVNANAQVLTPEYLEKVAALADVFRPYGIRVYLTARFSAPIEIGGLRTADPLQKNVIEWWNNKAKEIYSYIPDFGGFLVKANSEGQPGPQNYGRSHAEGANLLARAVKPYNGIVMWRAFVYSNEEPEDRAKQAYNEFKPLDGKFEDNVLIQVKNGPIDFQPREPFHPLFGAMEQTPVMMEFQVTQEYLGQDIHLTYLAPLYEECLHSDTYAKGTGSEVFKVINGSLFNYNETGIAGVSNIGDDRNWCGHPIAQANWYALGQLAWDPEAASQEIAEEWIRMTYSNNQEVIDTMLKIMMISREAGVNYRTPLGLHHQMAWHHHYGPGPWIKDKPRADWTSAYYNKADETGIGFDRTKTGSNAVSQYFSPLTELFGNIETCPEELLLWFHHVPWNYKMKSGNTLWEELCMKYYQGTDQVREMQTKWNSLEGKIDDERFKHVQSLLKIQVRDAIEWRNACLLYYQTFSKMPIPEKYEQPDQTLEYYMKVDRKYLPGS